MISLVLSVLLFCYGVFVAFLTIAAARQKSKPPAGPATWPGISVVIPFRNEAANLPALLASLLQQEYPGPWEVILVNDGSTDDYRGASAEVLASFPVPAGIIDAVFDSSARLTSKQQALDRGVAASRYEWCAFTDADMAFEKDWLASLARGAGGNSDFVFGHTRIAAGGGLLSAVERFQLSFLFSVAYSFHAAGIESSCMGNNMLVRKKAYAEIGGQAGIGYSIVEDRDLYRAFRRRGRKISTALPFSPKASTSACTSIHQFYHQMLRWARGGFSPGSRIFFAGLLFSLQNISLTAALAGFLSKGNTLLAVANILLTMTFLAVAFKKTRAPQSALFFPFYYVFLLAETFVFLFSFVITPKITWKARKV